MVLSKEYRLSKKRNFELVFKKGQKIDFGYFYIKILKNNLNINRFAVIPFKVSKKAVERNRLKRRVSEIFRILNKDFKKSYDIIFVARPSILNKKFKDLKKMIIEACKDLLY